MGDQEGPRLPDRDFDDAAEGFARWAAARSRATGDGPKAIYADGLAWPRERDVLLPGVTTVARLVAGVVTDTTRQLHEELAAINQVIPNAEAVERSYVFGMQDLTAVPTAAANDWMSAAYPGLPLTLPGA